MASGDAQRAWFPEMLEDLRQYWGDKPSWENLAAFCEGMTEKREKIKKARRIKPLATVCRNCGGKKVMTPTSIRSALFALKKIGVIDEVGFKELDREWAKHRTSNGLDAYGKKKKL